MDLCKENSATQPLPGIFIKFSMFLSCVHDQKQIRINSTVLDIKANGSDASFLTLKQSNLAPEGG